MSNEVRAVPSFRRNGKKPSCEPCRRSKYSCDHVSPICGRCQRRNITSQCQYHPAPMKGLTPSKKGLKRVDRSPHQDERPSQRAATRPDTPEDTSHIVSNQLPRFFLGSTSYNAVLEESQDHIGLTADSGGSQLPPPVQTQTKNARSRSKKLEEAVAVLEFLKDFEHLERIVQRWGAVERSMSMIGAFAFFCCDSVGKDVAKQLDLSSERAKVLLAERIFTNTAHPIPIHKFTKFQEFLDSYTGSSIRWDTLGIFFTACGLCCNMMTCDERELDFIGHREEDRQGLMHRLLEASNACVSFCEDVGHLSDAGMWLNLENCIYASQVLGDAHYLVWRKVGDLSTAIFAQGLHQQDKGTSNLPFWLVEMRRRTFGTAYSIDKLLCTFVGRPPRISQRYCTIVPPLDLEYSELTLEDAGLEKALSNIDEDGWNRSTKSRKSVYQRCFVFAAMLREEVLELSLGPFQEDMMQKSLDVIRRSNDLLASLPSYIQYSEDLWLSQDPVAAYLAAQEYLDMLYNEFMVRRMMVARLGDDHTELLHIAHKILSTVLAASQIRGARGQNIGCVPWIVVLHGLPTAGVLALELLQQKQSQLRMDHPPRPQVFPSSKIIQELSVFISLLRYVHAPGDGNYSLTEQARKTLQQILDKVLSMDSVTLAVPTPERAQLPSPISSSSALPDDGGTGMLFDFSWMDNAQIDADFWMSLPDHPLLSQPIS